MTRSLPGRAAPRVAAVLSLLALTAGCSSNALSSPPSAPSTTSTRPTTSAPPPPPPPAPAVGTCRQLDYGAISHYSNDTPAVPCSKPHTSYTFAVDTLPSDVSVEGVSIGNKSIQDAASSGCRGRFAGYVGGDPQTRALSRLSVTYFLPDQKGFDRGARWVRCDIVALRTSRALGPLPAHLSGFLDHTKNLHDYGVCSQGVPGGVHAALVMCTEPHLYRALTTIRLGSTTAPYPGAAVTGKKGQQRCAAHLKAKLGVATPYKFTWTYPTASDWASGQRFGYCWLKSHH